MSKGKKILVVDDDVDMVEAISVVLKNKGYEVHTGNNGDECLKLVKTVKPDLILLDVMMRTVDDGFQTAYKLRKDKATAKTPIIMITAVGKETGFKFDKEKDADFMPIEDYIEKPIMPEVLLKKVAELLK